MTPILVPGTGSWQDDNRVDWYCPGSPFVDFLDRQNLAPAFGRRYDLGYDIGLAPFIWSTDLAGVPILSRLATWAAGGAALAYFVEVSANLRGKDTAVIAHSHGLQPVLYSCAEQNLRVAQLISVGSPVRHDMLAIAKRARPRIGFWRHLHSDASDRWQWLGELFDSHFSIVRAHPLADENVGVPKVGHSELLRDASLFHLWVDEGWLQPLQRRPA